PLVCGVGPAVPETGVANGRAAWSEPRDGTQGGLGAPAGVQLGARADGAGRPRRRLVAGAAEFQRGPAGGECVRGGAVDGAGKGTRRTLPASAGGGRQPHRRGPAEPLRATPAQATPQGISIAERIPGPSPSPLGRYQL